MKRFILLVVAVFTLSMLGVGAQTPAKPAEQNPPPTKSTTKSTTKKKHAKKHAKHGKKKHSTKKGEKKGT